MAEFPAWGIHITVSSIRAVKLESDGERVRVVAHDQVDFAEDIDDLTSLERFGAMSHAVAVFAKRHDFDRCRVFVSVDASAAFNRFVEAPILQGSTLERILELEGQQQIPFPLEDVYWDHKVLDRRDEEGVIDVMLFAVKKDVVDERLRRLEKLRFPIDGVQLAPVSLYNFAVKERMAKNGYVLVSVDHDRTDVVFCHDKQLWFRSVPLGYHSLFERVRDEIEPKHRAAVRILRGEDECPEPKKLDMLRAECAEMLAGEIGRLVKYYESAREGHDLKGIVLIPGSRFVPPMSRRLKELTGLDVYGIKGFRTLEIDPGIVTPELEAGVAPLAHATGLALQGLDAADVGVKLYPPTLERVIAGRRVFYVLSVLALFVVVITMWIRSAGHLEEIQDKQGELGNLISSADENAEKLKKDSRESEIKDAYTPYLAAGANRLLPVRAASEVLGVLAAINEGRQKGDGVYLVRIATKSSDTSTDRRSSREVLVTVGMRQKQPMETMRDWIDRDFCKALAKRDGVSGVKITETFVAPDLAFDPVPGVEEKKLRRRFVMCRVAFSYAPVAATNAGAGGN